MFWTTCFLVFSRSGLLVILFSVCGVVCRFLKMLEFSFLKKNRHFLIAVVGKYQLSKSWAFDWASWNNFWAVLCYKQGKFSICVFKNIILFLFIYIDTLTFSFYISLLYFTHKKKKKICLIFLKWQNPSFFFFKSDNFLLMLLEKK